MHVTEDPRLLRARAVRARECSREAAGNVLVSYNVSSSMKSATRGIRFLAPSGAQDRSPGRKPWGREPSPRLRHPSPARAGEGTGGEGGCADPRLTPCGLHSTAPIGAVEPFSEYGLYSTNFSYRILEARLNFKKDVKFDGTNSISPLASTKVSRNELKTNSKRSGKTRCEYAKEPKQTYERVRLPRDCKGS
jgi:hypothetical protein